MATSNAVAHPSRRSLRSLLRVRLCCCVLRLRIDRRHNDLAYQLQPAAMAEEGALGDRPVHRRPGPTVGQPGALAAAVAIGALAKVSRHRATIRPAGVFRRLWSLLAMLRPPSVGGFGIRPTAEHTS